MLANWDIKHRNNNVSTENDPLCDNRFRETGHDFNKHGKFTIIEKI